MPSALTRLTLRRERRSILAWSLGGGCLTLYCILMFNTMYATVEERQAAALTYSTPAAAVFTGPGFGMRPLPPLPAWELSSPPRPWAGLPSWPPSWGYSWWSPALAVTRRAVRASCCAPLLWDAARAPGRL